LLCAERKKAFRQTKGGGKKGPAFGSGPRGGWSSQKKEKETGFLSGEGGKGKLEKGVRKEKLRLGVYQARWAEQKVVFWALWEGYKMG